MMSICVTTASLTLITVYDSNTKNLSLENQPSKHQHVLVSIIIFLIVFSFFHESFQFKLNYFGLILL